MKELPLNPSFCEAYCARYGCAPADFEVGAFRRSLPIFLWPVAGMVGRWKPGFFKDDQDAIRRLGATRSRDHFRAELNDLHYVTQRDGSWLRRRVGLRVSLARLERLHARIYPARNP